MTQVLGSSHAGQTARLVSAVEQQLRLLTVVESLVRLEVSVAVVVEAFMTTE